MEWIRRNAGDLRAWQARRPVFMLLTAAGAVVLAACVACGVAISSPTITTSNGGGSGSTTSGGAGSGSATSGGRGSGSTTSGGRGSGSATSSGGGSSARSCSTQGVGGDTLAPLPCASHASPSGTGIVLLPAPTTVAPTTVAPTTVTPTTVTPIPVTPPVVTAISPVSGSTVGGDSVIIAGSGFTGATAVDFGSASAQMTVDSDTEITATSPPGNGTVDVTVVTPAGTSATSPADQFSYQG